LSPANTYTALTPSEYYSLADNGGGGCGADGKIDDGQIIRAASPDESELAALFDFRL